MISFLNAIFPKRCLCCSEIEIDGEFCHKCFTKLAFIQKPFCTLCGIPLPYADKNSKCSECFHVKPTFNEARSLFVYDDVIKYPILALKHSDHTQNAKRFATLLYNLMPDYIQKTDMIVPIPLYYT